MGLCRWGAALLGLPVVTVAAGSAVGVRGAARRLDGQECNSFLLEVVKPLALEQYDRCLVEKANTTDMRAAGADIAIKAECWCQYNVKDVVDEQHCCQDPSYAALCSIRCDDDCTSTKAQTCMAECPAMCLEQDYTFDGCRCRENDCFEHAICIAEQGRNHTQSGQLDPLCNDRAWERSPEIRSYYTCMQQQPRRTNWQRWNAQHHCVCQANLKAGLERESCCGSVWGQPLCDQECHTGANCTTPEAEACLEGCRTNCSMVHPNLVTVNCQESCFDANSTCAKYKTCPPREHPAFEYVCSDGTSPDSTGCCWTWQRGPQEGTAVKSFQCPNLCDIRHTYYFSHGKECQCFGCPTSLDAASDKMKAIVLEAAMAQGQANLHSMARYVGLRQGPTPRMQEMQAEMNLAIRAAIDGHTGRYDASLEQEIATIAAQWNNRILQEAMRAKLCQDDPSQCPTQAPAQATQPPAMEEGKEERGARVVILVIVGAAVVLGLILGILVVAYMIRAKKNAAGTNVGPNPGDSNVVVGRPVDGAQGGGDPAASGAAAGAPVATSKAGEPAPGKA